VADALLAAYGQACLNELQRDSLLGSGGGAEFLIARRGERDALHYAN
jgi:hypothetical protein